MIRRVDGREPGEAIVARTAAPLGLDFHVGLDDSQFGRVAHMARTGAASATLPPSAC